VTRGGDAKVQEKIFKKQERISDLLLKKQTRLANLELMLQLSPKAPEILGCAYVVPLTQVEYQGHYGMSRDDEAEAIAMKTVMDYEISVGWTPTDVSANNEGYDIRSRSPEDLKRYIEVKGRSGPDGSVMVSENEMNRLALENRLTRVGAHLKPVEDDEIFEVVRRRLFEDLGDPSVLERVVNAYYVMYQSMPSEIPNYATQSAYRERLKKSYPFHPELLDIFRLRWAATQKQKRNLTASRMKSKPLFQH
jgi:Domain of unknown function (DUF3883)/Protein of unknown function (DUF499)